MPFLSFGDQAAHVDELLATRPLMRSINYHNTPRSRLAEFEQQLAQCRRHFTAVDETDLDTYLRTGRWHKPKPGLIVALYEGYRNHYDVFLPLLSRYGFVGWFFPITGFIQAPVAAQVQFAAEHDIVTIAGEYADGRYAMSWDELREIDQRHVNGSHARRHIRLSDLDETSLAGEVLGSQRDCESFLGRKVRTFVSYGGPAYGEFPPADRLIDQAGYQFVVSNYQIQRIREWTA